MPRSDIIMNTIIFIIAGIGPIILCIRYRFYSIICALISLLLSLLCTVVLIEMLIIPDKSVRKYAESNYFRWNELHEVFWLILPIIVFITCIIINYRRKKAKGEKRPNLVIRGT
jgi:hypothetical protein